MKPIKSLSTFSAWLMRLAVLFFSVSYYLKNLEVVNFHSVIFYVSSGYVVFSVLLFAGGFLRNQSLTVISALILTLLTGYQSVIFIKAGIDYNLAVFVILGSITVHFLSSDKNRSS